MSDLFDLTGRKAMVVGAGSGLGLQLSCALARQGADIALVDIVEERLAPAAEKVAELGVETYTHVCDCSDSAQVVACVEDIIERFGRIDILVYSAGIAISHDSRDIYFESWDKVIDVNLNGMFYVDREVGKHMVEQRYGKIINMVSGYGEIVPPNWMWPLAPYNASKGGARMLTKALAVEWAPYGVTVNAIGPGYFKSGLTEKSIESDKMKEYIHYFNPMGRVGQPGELDGVCILLASDASSYITGQHILVNGGGDCV